MRCFCMSLFVLTTGLGAVAEDWPTYLHDNRRSGITSESVSLPLREAWHYVHEAPPQPAWEGPAKWDAYSGRKDLKSMRNFDPAFHLTAASDMVFFGSSVTDAAHCLDAASGEERWCYYTDGPVRLPPTFHEGHAYFGSDDGYAYCVDVEGGRLTWRHAPAPRERSVPVNGKLVSLSPVRTGVLIDNGTAYFAASLLPWRPSYLCAVSAATGTFDGSFGYASEHQGVVFQGAMLMSKDNLYVLQGRSAPVIFSRAGGEMLGTVGDSGGVVALITEDDTFIAGSPNQKEDRFSETAGGHAGDQLAFYESANRLVIANGVAYLQAEGELKAFDRTRYLGLQKELIAVNKRREALEQERKALNESEDADKGERMKTLDAALAEVKERASAIRKEARDCYLWRVACDLPHALIKVRDALIAGGTGAIALFDAGTGEERWRSTVDGAAHGLAVANGRLLVSTDTGHIYAYASAMVGTPGQG